jgi:DNA polymerase V
VGQNVVVAAINSEILVKRLSIEKEQTTLIAENKEYKPIHIRTGDDLHIWGVITNVIHSLKKTC